MAYTLFSGYSAYKVTDRDGYDENVFPIGVMLCFYSDGKLSVWESEGVITETDPEQLGEPYFKGAWQKNENDLVSFNLQRVRPAEEVELELAPGEASNYYAYPSSAVATVLEDGVYSAAFNGTSMYLLFTPNTEMDLYELELKGEADTDFPRFPENMQFIKPGEQWNTFQWGPEEVDVQFHSDDEPKTLTRYLLIRFYYPEFAGEENRIEAWENTEPLKYDFIQLNSPDLVGTWTHEYPEGYIFQLKRQASEHAYNWATYWHEGRYMAAYHDGKLEVQHFPTGAERYEELIHHRYSMSPVSPTAVSMSSTSEDPYPAWEALWKREIERRVEALDDAQQHHEQVAMGMVSEKESGDRKGDIPGLPEAEWPSTEENKTNRAVGLVIFIILISIIVAWML